MTSMEKLSGGEGKKHGKDLCTIKGETRCRGGKKRISRADTRDVYEERREDAQRKENRGTLNMFFRDAEYLTYEQKYKTRTK